MYTEDLLSKSVSREHFTQSAQSTSVVNTSVLNPQSRSPSVSSERQEDFQLRMRASKSQESADTPLQSITVKDLSRSASLIGTDKIFLDMPLPRSIVGTKKINAICVLKQLPATVKEALQRKNPHCDAYVTDKNLSDQYSVETLSARRQVDALLAHEGSVLQSKLNHVLNPRKMSVLNKLGITLQGDAQRGFSLYCEKTGRSLGISEQHLRYALSRSKGDVYSDYSKISMIQDALVRANKQFSTSVSIGELLPRYFIFGAPPEAVVKHFDSRIQPVVNAVAEEMYVPRRDLSAIKNPKILLYTVNGGGGHLAQSKAIANHVKTLGMKSELLMHDTCEFDALAYLTEGAASESDPFNRVLQKKIGLQGEKLDLNEVMDVFSLYGDTVVALHHLFGNDNHFDVARKALEDPDYVAMIDSFPFYSGIEGAAISNGVPYVRWGTDFDTWGGLLKSYDVVDPALGRIALTSGDVVANRKLDLTVRDHEDIFENADVEAGPIRTSASGIHPDMLQDPRVFVAGFPLRSEIKKMNSVEREQKRAALGLVPEDKMLMVMMGSQGKSELFKITGQLLKKPPINSSGKVHVVVAVGSNFSIKDEIRALESHGENRGRIVVRFADEVMKIPNQFLEKPSNKRAFKLQ